MSAGRQVAARAVTGGVIGLFLLYSIFPIYWTLLLSIKDVATVLAVPPRFVFDPTAANYAEVSAPVLPFLVNSVVVTASVTVLSMAAGTLGAYALARFPVRARPVLMFAVLTTVLIPPVVIAIPLYYLSVRLGIQGSLLAVIMAQTLFNTPFVVWIMRSSFDELPLDMEEAAMLDGASTWQVFARIAVPLVRPGIVAASTLSAFYSWNEFLLTNVLSGMDSKTLPVYVASFNRDTAEILWGQLGATVVLGVVPILACTLLIQRHLVRGLTFGAVKG